MTRTQVARLSPAERVEAHFLRNESRYYVLAGFILILVFWGPRLFWGLWLDEAGTFWMAHEGWLSAARKCWNWPGQSILFGVIESLFCRPGRWMEPLLRAPSVAGGIAAAFLLYRVAERVAGKGAGFLAAGPFLCTPQLVMAATGARPYALALAASIGSFWKLHEWLETRRRADLLWYIAFSVLTLYLHYFFGFIFVVQFAYLLCRARMGKPAPWKQAALAALLIAASLLPLAGHIRLLFHQADTLSFAPRPSALDLFYLSLPFEAVYGAFLAWVLALVFLAGPAQKPVLIAKEEGLLMVLWLFLGPLVFELVSRHTAHRIFVDRYLLFAFPAAFVLLACFLLGLRRWWMRLAAVGCVAMFATNTNFVRKSLQPGPEEWRAPIATVKKLSPSGDLPVFFRSGLVESTYKDWKAGPNDGNYLFAPLLAYPISNPIIPLPYELNEDAKRQVMQAVEGRLAKTSRFCLVARDESAIVSWMKSTLAPLGFRITTYHPNTIEVILFERPRGRA